MIQSNCEFDYQFRSPTIDTNISDLIDSKIIIKKKAQIMRTDETMRSIALRGITHAKRHSIHWDDVCKIDYFE